MKKYLLSTLGAMLLCSASVTAAETVPYTSSLYPHGSLDEGWSTANDSRGAESWRHDNESKVEQLAAAGGSISGAKKGYDSSKKADCWLFSPALTLSAGTEYTVGIWARTDPRGNSEVENFKITVASEATSAAQKAGTILIDKPSYVNKGDFEHFTTTFTPAEDGEYHFGLNCYSAADMYTMFLTGFSVTSGEDPGEDPVTPPDETVKGEAMPYMCGFETQEVYDKWSTAEGPDAASVTGWTYSSYGKCADFSNSNKLQEDHYLISPALAFDKAGTYAIDTRAMAYTALEMLIGTDKDDLSTFDLLHKFENTGYVGDDANTRLYFDVETPATYYIAYRACGAEGEYAYTRLWKLNVKLDVPVPGIVTDLVAVPDRTDALEVALSWTYPDKTNAGATLDAITKAELFRNGEVIKTFYNVRPGSFTAYADTDIPAAGAYTYKVICYNDNGYNTDEAAIEVKTGYVGRPTVEAPCTMFVNADNAALFTIEDANEDGIGWIFNAGAWSKTFKSEVPDDDTVMDDYIATPYVHLAPGYYSISMTTGGKYMSYELGYATNRHIIAETFVKVTEVIDDSANAATDKSFTIAVDTEGDYCFVVHHIGKRNPDYLYYNSIELSAFAIEDSELTPMPATDIIVKESTDSDGSITAHISWLNPAVDNAGRPLESIESMQIIRNGEEYAPVVVELIPGQRSELYDIVPEGGEYSYRIKINLASGTSSTSEEVFTYIGPGLETPYETTGFKEWTVLNLDDDYYQWEDDGKGHICYYKSYSWSGDPDDYLLSPLFELKEGKKYEVQFTTGACNGSPYTFDIVSGTSVDPTKLAVVATITSGEHDIQHVFSIETSAIEALEESDSETESPEPIVFKAAPGKNLFGAHAYSTGEITLTQFHIKETGDLTGTHTVAAAAGRLSYSGMTARAQGASRIAAYSLDGTLLAAADGDSLSLEGLARGTVAVIVATIDGNNTSLKVIL